MQSGIKPHAYTPLLFHSMDVAFFLKLVLEKNWLPLKNRLMVRKGGRVAFLYFQYLKEMLNPTIKTREQ